MTGSDCDVLILGGGPAGSTTAAILRKYNPDLSVTLVERDVFPRYHIGESLVLEVNRTLIDAGVLDAVEDAGFMKKAGATFVWGKDRKPWSFLFRETTGRRPHFEQLKDYTWHVDRARFDQLLLEHARDAGTQVIQPARVTRILEDNNRVSGAELETEDGVQQINARFVVDATGRSGVLAKRFGTREFDPLLKNVATFGYFKGGDIEDKYSLSWEEATVTVVTLPDGWLWYIPVRPSILSVGVITNAERFKELTKDGIEQHFFRGIQSAPEPARWLKNAELIHFEGAPQKIMVESDYNYVHSQMHGPGWALVGDSAGFVDPLFTFGVFMATSGAQLLAYALNTLFDGRYPGATEDRLLAGYEQHMRGYYDSFRAMLAVFYGFNSSKEAFWAETRKLLRGQALPPDMSDREAFRAFTLGYGVNTLLFRDATVHFGQVALHRIRDMCLNEEKGQVELSEMGEYNIESAPLDAKVKIVTPYRALESVVPVPNTGRMVPMLRVEFGEEPSESNASVKFPRYFFLPDALLGVLEAMDGEHTVRELLELAAAADLPKRVGGTTPARFVEHMVRSLTGMGVLDVKH